MVTGKQSLVRKIIIFLSFVILVVIVVPFARNLKYQHQTWQRPLFHNIYGKNDRMIFSEWHWSYALCDKSGPCIIADYKLNFLVILMSSNVKDLHRIGIGDRNSVVFRFHNSNDGIRVIRDENALVAYLPDGSTKRASIDSGLANEWYELCHQDARTPVLRPIESYLNKYPNPEIEALLGEVKLQQEELVD